SVACDDLSQAVPAGGEAVPEAAERARGREMAVPVVLGVLERERVADLGPERERVGGRDGQCRGQAEERLAPLPLAPGEQDERRQERDPDRAGQDREACDDPGGEEPTPLGERE